ncbi:MAG TPA: DUF4082 domain-containing protein [Nevskiaceae bacterium]|nr:DUF4082 domain-containing protein [Nevskiaceae bacterium]
MRRLWIVIAGVTLVAMGGASYVVLKNHNADKFSKNPVQVPDTTPPTITFSNISEGQTLSGDTAIIVEAHDDKAVQKVEYYIDDVLIKVTYAPPFTYTWPSSTVVDGAHIIKAKAYDAAGNNALVQVGITTVNGVAAAATPSASLATTPTATKPSTAKSTASSQTSSQGGGTDNGGGQSTPPDTTAPSDPTSLYVTHNAAGFDALSWTPATDNVGVAGYQILRDGQQIATSTVAHYYDMRISDGNNYQYSIKAYDAASNVSGASSPVSITLAPRTTWGSTVPTDTDSDTTAVEVGIRFRARVAGKATGVRFYKASIDTGSHVGNLWTNGGTKLATVNFTNETSSGWQTATFSTPVTLTPDTTYVVSYYASQGRTTGTPSYFGTDHFDDYLISLSIGSDGPNAVYKIGAGFPNNQSGGAFGYGADIAFAPDTPAAQTPTELATKRSDYYAQWSHGPSTSPNTWPTGIWLQSPERLNGGVPNGINYQNLGIHYDIGMFGWPGDDNLFQGLADTNWKAFTATGDRTTLVGVDIVKTDPRGQHSYGYWLEDEPDLNYNGDPVAWAQDSIAALTPFANAVRAADPTRPTYANFGKPMAIDNWLYQHVQTTSPSADYRAYCAIADVASADYYGNSDPFESADYHGPWTYGEVIDNMRRHCGEAKAIWGFAETGAPTSITPDAPTPDEFEQAVWNMVIHGANGMIYFAQNFYGSFVEDAFLNDPAMRARVGAVDARLQSLAAVLNAPTVKYAASASSNVSGVPIDTLVKQNAGHTYVLTQASGSRTKIGSDSVTGTIWVNTTATTATVVDENRTVPIVNGQIQDSFDPYEVHIYRF